METSSVYNQGCSTSQSGRPGESHTMNKHHSFRFCVRLGFFLAFAGSISAQTTPNKTLVVNGNSVEAVVLQIGGHSYIDVESLAQVTNGTVFIEPNRVVLTIPVAKSAGAPAAKVAVTAPAAAPPAAGTVSAQPAAATTTVAVATPIDGPAPAAAAPVAAPEPAPVQPQPGLSRAFATSAIAALAD